MLPVDGGFEHFGIEGWGVLKAVGTPVGGNRPCGVIADLEFDTADRFRAAVAAEGPPEVVIADLVGAAT